jgi:ATP-dependent DNA helicase RecG
VISNPGGLYGITVERLGHDAVTSARNARLVALCQHVRTPETGARVIEALASGIPTIRTALMESGLPPAHYVDAGIRFTVVLHRTTSTPPSIGLNESEQRVYDALVRGPQQVTDLQKLLGLSPANIRKILRALRGHGLIEQLGGRGRSTSYRRPPE